MIERSELMAIYPLAIMKAGAAYMPLDFTFPEERLQYMYQDANIRLILSEEDRVKQAMTGFKGEVFMAEDLQSLPANTDRLPEPLPSQRFVILYTSGSTGKPKGVILEHHNIVNFCHWYIREAAITQEDRLLAFSNFGFDTHMMDIYPALFTGASVHILSSDIRMNMEAMNSYMEQNRITIAFLTTQVGHLFATSFNNTSLRLLTVAGEKLQPLKKPNYSVINAYGPTECFVSTFYNITHDYDSALI
jgi:non-ribosomal peptide synthetase component F